MNTSVREFLPANLGLARKFSRSNLRFADVKPIRSQREFKIVKPEIVE